jgi:hypothetical protein
MEKKEKLKKLRGWFPQEPKLAGKATATTEAPVKKENKAQLQKASPYWSAAFFVFWGALNLLSGKGLTLALAIFSLYIGIGIIVTIFLKNRWQVARRVTVGVLLIAFGIWAGVFIDFPLTLLSPLSGTGVAIVPILAAVAVLFAFTSIMIADVRKGDGKYSLKRMLQPYVVVVAIVLLTYVVIVSDLQFVYAIPIAIIVSGVLLLAGLNRFAVVETTLAILLFSIIVLGSAFAGVYTVNLIALAH